MMTTCTPDQSETRTDQPASPPICNLLIELGQCGYPTSQVYRQALEAIAGHFGAPYASLRVTHATSTLDEQVNSADGQMAQWASMAGELSLESQAENTPLARLFTVTGTSLRVAVLAAPVCEQVNRPIGAFSLIVRCQNTATAKMLLNELTALVTLMATQAGPTTNTQSSEVKKDDALKRAVVKATDFQSLHELAFAITNSLKNKFDCNQVTLGKIVRGRIRLLSISGLDNVYPKSPGVKRICQAMEECLDRGEVICCQDSDTWSAESPAARFGLHKHWHDEAGLAVASVPMTIGDRCVAVLALIRPKKLPFSHSELAQIRETVAPFAPAMELVAKADRHLVRHSLDSLKSGVQWMLAPRGHGRRALILAALVGMALFCLATIRYKVTVPSQIIPSEVRCFAAPFEGTIAACHVKIGDAVAAGQLLYEMDTADLHLELDRLESELAILGVKLNQALSAEDARLAALQRAEMQITQAQLAITRHRLETARSRAPTDGTVSAGDLTQRVGEVVPLGAPLLEFVPHGDWSVQLLIPETMADELQVGFAGRFACTARPDEVLSCRIVRIHPSSTPVDGKNVFIAEAQVEGNPAWMRAGMEGVARIDAGRRRVWWVALHRVIHFVRLNFWL